MYDDRELTTITRRAGFKSITTTLVKKEGFSPSASDLAKGIVEGNPVYLAILEKDASLVNTIKDHAEALAVRHHSNMLYNHYTLLDCAMPYKQHRPGNRDDG